MIECSAVCGYLVFHARASLHNCPPCSVLDKFLIAQLTKLPLTCKITLCILLNEIMALYCLIQNLFDNILKNRMILQFICRHYEQIGILHCGDEIQDPLVLVLLHLDHLLTR
jgi:hypothetical protein